jgi:hypothetical protein
MDEREWDDIAQWAERLMLDREQVQDLKEHYKKMCEQDLTYLRANKDCQFWLVPDQEEAKDCIRKIPWVVARREGQGLRRDRK